MSHRSADDLSDSIDRWLSREGTAGPSHLAEVVEALSEAFPPLADESSRERVRRRLAGYTPSPKSAQQVLIERAVDEIEFLQRRLTGDEYVPWPAVAGAAAMVVATVALAVWLRRRGVDEGLAAA
jgi:predicted phage tail protein